MSSRRVVTFRRVKFTVPDRVGRRVASKFRTARSGISSTSEDVNWLPSYGCHGLTTVQTGGAAIGF
ncbi:MAG TPA: hypothetical protein VLS45_06915 [Methylomicrobium sp.]|nr:hypothetical protein [Methylomicrobium sp.]